MFWWVIVPVNHCPWMGWGTPSLIINSPCLLFHGVGYPKRVGMRSWLGQNHIPRWSMMMHGPVCSCKERDRWSSWGSESIDHQQMSWPVMVLDNWLSCSFILIDYPIEYSMCVLLSYWVLIFHGVVVAEAWKQMYVFTGPGWLIVTIFIYGVFQGIQLEWFNHWICLIRLWWNRESSDWFLFFSSFFFFFFTPPIFQETPGSPVTHIS